MSKDIVQWVKKCEICARFQGRKPIKVTSLQPIRSRGLFDQVHMDAAKFPISHRGYQYVLVMIDHMSRWTEYVPLKENSAKKVANAFCNTWVMRYGIPVNC